MNLDLAMNILGGLGLLLLGMKLMTDGLKLAGGRTLKKLLSKSTKTPFRGLSSGFAITSMVQSSSAVTVAAIGFVNAGLLTLEQTVWVVYGSNIGTTTTAWIVAFLGLKINIKAYALPMVAFGTALWLTGNVSRRTGVGEALAGFGLFFLGVEVLQSVFKGMGNDLSLAQYASSGMLGVAIFVGIGFLLTFLMQSSSASIALVLTATASGMVPLDAAAAAVVGANVGTTSTAMLAVIGATSNAKRIAVLHVLFNFITGVAAVLLLPFLVSAIVSVRTMVGLGAAPSSVLALFHTIFNILGVLLLWPITPWLVRRVKKRFRTEEEDLSKPIYLDETVAQTPTLGLNALVMELGRSGEVARRMSMIAMRCEAPPCKEIEVNKTILDRLIYSINKFTSRLSREGLTRRVSESLPDVLRVGQYWNSAAEAAQDAENIKIGLSPLKDERVLEKMQEMLDTGARLILFADAEDEEFSETGLRIALEAFEQKYHELKDFTLEAGSGGAIKSHQLVGWLDYFSRIRRMIEQVAKGALLLSGLHGIAMMFESAEWKDLSISSGEK